jgi:hypothetical protein
MYNISPMEYVSLRNSVYLQEAVNYFTNPKGSKKANDEITKAQALLKRLSIFSQKLEACREPLSPLSKRKIDALKFNISSMLSDAALTDMEKNLAILLNLGFIKHLLQLEVFLFHLLETPILMNLKIFKDERLNSLWRDIPAIFGQIRVVRGSKLHFTIPLAPIKEYFNSLRLELANLSFHAMLLQLVNSSILLEDQFIIPHDKITDFESILPYLDVSDESTKVLAQIILACSLEKLALEEDSITISDMFHQNEKIVRFFSHFSNSLDPDQIKHVASAPLLLLTAKLFKKNKIDPTKTFFTKDFLESMETYLKSDWISECADFYAYILKIESFARGYFKETLSLDKVIALRKYTFIEATGDDFRKEPLTRNYPIHSGNMFCRSRDEFLNIIFSGKQKFHLESLSISPPQAILASSSPHPFDHRHFDLLSCHTPALPGRVDELTHSSEERLSPLAHFIDVKLAESMQTTKIFLSDLTYHQRVLAWFTSKETGLAHWGFNEESENAPIEKNRLVERHFFPPEILLYAFNPLYSQKINWTSSDAISYDVYRSVIQINTKPYILEANLTDEKLLFHFYARPIQAVDDYFTIIQGSSAVFPELTKAAAVSSSPTLRIEIGTIIKIEADGNVSMNFDGKHYKISRLEK